MAAIIVSDPEYTLCNTIYAKGLRKDIHKGSNCLTIHHSNANIASFGESTLINLCIKEGELHLTEQLLMLLLLVCRYIYIDIYIYIYIYVILISELASSHNSFYSLIGVVGIDCLSVSDDYSEPRIHNAWCSNRFQAPCTKSHKDNSNK